MNKKIYSFFFSCLLSKNIPPLIRTTIPMIDNSGSAIAIVPRAVLDFPPPSKNSLLFHQTPSLPSGCCCLSLGILSTV